MDRIRYFFWLGTMMVEVLAFLWWLVLPALLALVGSLFAPSTRGLAGFRPDHWRILLLGLFPVGILVCATIFAQAGQGSFAYKGVYALLFAHLFLAGYFAWHERQQPWFFIALSALLLICSLASGVVAGMAISDVWL